MAMIEQNISGVKLEKLRQKAVKKTKFLKKNAEGRFCCLFASCHVKAKKYRTFFDFDQWGRSGFWDHRHWNHHDFRRDFVGILHSGSGYGVLSIVVMEKNVQ
nr:hypothetical protein [uncultured Anaerotignum sp.]